MSAAAEVKYVPALAPIWSVPATLADFECVHGELEGCTQCARADLQAELELELLLKVKQ